MKLHKSPNRLTLFDVLEEQLKKKGISTKDVPPAKVNTHTTGTTTSFKQRVVVGDNSQTLDAVTTEAVLGRSSRLSTSDYSWQNNYTVSADSNVSTAEVERFGKIYGELEALMGSAKMVMIMPRCFTFKDKDGNPLFSVEDNEFTEGEEFEDTELDDVDETDDDHGNKKK